MYMERRPNHVHKLVVAAGVGVGLSKLVTIVILVRKSHSSIEINSDSSCSVVALIFFCCCRTQVGHTDIFQNNTTYVYILSHNYLWNSRLKL